MSDEQSVRNRVAERAAQSRVQLESGSWWHSIDLGGTVTPGIQTLEELQKNWMDFRLPEDLTGKRVLDVGCWDGFYSFEAERRGAQVVALDCFRPPNFFRAHEALHSKVEFHEMSVYEVSRRRLGSFDIVLFLGVLYHLRHPLLGLERVCEVTREDAIIDSHVSDEFFTSARPVMEFYERDELARQYDNWWGPNCECLIQMTRAAGFAGAGWLRRAPTRATLRAYRQWKLSPDLEASPSIHVPAVFNPVTWEPSVPLSGRRAFLGMYAKGLPEDVTCGSLRIHVGGFGINPIFVGDSEYAGSKQINAPVPPGIDPGAATLWIEAGTQRSNEVEVRFVEGTPW